MHRTQGKWVRTIPLLGLALAVLFCSKDYNPFDDLTNAKVHVLSWGFADSVQLYQSGTLSAVVAVREQVDSFMVSAPGNRFWTDTAVPIATVGAGTQTYYFHISFCDTGRKTITVKSYRSNGEVVPQEYRVRVYSPLRQSTVVGYLGRPLTLSTPQVVDKDVRYRWDFGGGRICASAAASTMDTLYDGALSGSGTLQVTDLSGGHGSPLCTFTFTLADTSLPVITCKNDSLRGDTIVTADSILAFKAMITENGVAPVESCSVNGSGFDLVNARTLIYTKLFTDMPRFTRTSGPLTITVWARDYVQHVTLRTFRAIYDPAGSRDPARVTIAIPSTDTGRTRTPDFLIYGEAENYTGAPLTLRLLLNGVADSSSRIIAGDNSSWTWRVRLDTLVNTVEVCAYNGANQKLASSGRKVLIFDPSAPDNIAPMIWEISAAGGHWVGNRLYSEQSSLDAQIIAFDDGSGVDSLWVNNKFIAPDSANGYLWHALLGPLLHQPQGNGVIIKVKDRTNNWKDSAITAYYNTPPALVSPPAIPSVLCLDSSYSYMVPALDAENDAMTLQVDSLSTSSAKAMAKVIGRTLFLHPTADGLGRSDTLVMRVYDGYELSAPLCYYFTTSDCSLLAKPVHFLTRENDFPALLQAGADTLRIRLRVDSTPPPAGLRYSASFSDRAQAPVLSKDTSSLLLWVPAPADTGFRYLRVSVGNGRVAFDSITPTLAVVPKNQYPCSLSHRFTGDTSVRGELGFFTPALPETLYCLIRDQDDPRVESYTVTVTQQNVNTVTTMNKRDFFIVVRPEPLRGLDTLRVRVRDLTGTADSAMFIIRYPNPYAGWRFTKDVRLNTTASGANTATNVYAFPVLIRLTRTNFNFSQARRNGEDLRFSKPDGTPLAYEIERFDSVQNLAEIWVKVDTVYGSDSSHYFVMRWGNASAPNASSASAVFDTAKGFAGVWHFSPGDSLGDATANRNLLANTQTTQTQQAEIGSGRHFNGTSAFASAPDQPCLNIKSAITLSAWARVTDPSKDQKIIAKTATRATSAFILGVINNQIYPEFWSSDGTHYTFSAGQITAGQWTHLAITWARGDSVFAYINGVRVGSIAASTADLQTVSNGVLLGTGFFTSTYQFFLNGDLDEARLSGTDRSATWIKLCYMNQKAADALVTLK